MKQFMTLCLTAVLTLGCLAVSVPAGEMLATTEETELLTGADGTVLDSGTDGNISWKIVSTPDINYGYGKLVITGTGRMRDYQAPNDCCPGYVHAPWNVDWYGAGSKYGKYLNGIEIGNGITYIGANAFQPLGQYAGQISEVVIPDSVTEIGKYAFYNQPHLAQIYIPASVKVIGEGAIWMATRVKCPENSTAHKYAMENNLSVTLTESSSVIPSPSPSPVNPGNKGIEINETNFPDSAFRAFVKSSKIDYDGDGYLNDAYPYKEISQITLIDVSNKGIKSLKGIEFFANLNTLSCKNNQLTELDVSKNDLIFLYCSGNQLSSLKLGNSEMLQTVSCYSNASLTQLDISKCPKLLKAYEGGLKGNVRDIPSTSLYKVSDGNSNYTLELDSRTILKTGEEQSSEGGSQTPSDSSQTPPGRNSQGETQSETQSSSDINNNSASQTDTKITPEMQQRMYELEMKLIKLHGTRLKVTAKGLKKNKVTLKAGKTLKLKVSTDAEKVSFKSSKKKVASVTKAGKITARKKGTAKITVKAGQLTKVITVKVK